MQRSNHNSWLFEACMAWIQGLSIPCVLGPKGVATREAKSKREAAVTGGEGEGEGRPTPAAPFWLQMTVWVMVQTWIGSYFFTHYFYTLLGVRYRLPTGKLSINNVPISMYLMAYPCVRRHGFPHSRPSGS
jgi:hypothetical protein